MSKAQEKRDSILKLLVDLVDEDISQDPHLPTMLTLPLHLSIGAIVLFGTALLWVSTLFAGSLFWTLLIGAGATWGLALTIRYSQTEILDDNERIERFRRIRKNSKFKPIINPRNELLLFSLLRIRDALPIPLREATLEMPDEFKEERLLHYLLEP
ncbi:MAG: hypothetical protein ACLP5V_01730 [Candidatus Bathyarchaeia archaeon]